MYMFLDLILLFVSFVTSIFTKKSLSVLAPSGNLTLLNHSPKKAENFKWEQIGCDY